MGLGIGIGMGWPMTSTSVAPPVVMGYFIIQEKCFEPNPPDWTSQLINTNLYNTGDYVDGVDNKGNTFRFRLGATVPVPGNNIINIFGPVYTSCPVYFRITGSCKGAIMVDWTSQLLADTSIYNEGDYVNGSPPMGGSDRYILGVIQQTPGSQIAELYGPAFSGCE